MFYIIKENGGWEATNTAKNNFFSILFGSNELIAYICQRKGESISN